jgi:two-component system CheB/CheR fusion protein
MQKKLIPLFHYSLTPGGILFLGSAETVGTFTDLFAPLAANCGSFRRTDSALRSGARLNFPRPLPPPRPHGTETRPAPKPPPSLQSLADQLVLEHYAPPAVLVDDKGNILYVSGRTGKYLEPAAGKANWNIFAMAREGLRYELATLSTKRSKKEASVVGPDSKSGRTAGSSSWILPSSVSRNRSRCGGW